MLSCVSLRERTREGLGACPGWGRACAVPRVCLGYGLLSGCVADDESPSLGGRLSYRPGQCVLARGAFLMDGACSGKQPIVSREQAF